MKTIAGKTVLLTGASKGIGVFIARAIAREQATIIGVARSKEDLDKVGIEVKALGSQWLAIPFDLSNIKALSELVETINQRVGKIDILINNAGREKYDSFPNYSLADLQSILEINLLATMELTRLLLPSMLGTNSGHIVNVASLAGKKGAPYNSIYSASKAGVIAWTSAIRQELSGTNVGISAICPGYVSSVGMTARTQVPIPKLGGTSTPEDVANAVVSAIKHNKAEVIVNQDFITEGITKLLLAIGQFFPRFADIAYRRLGITLLNQRRAINPYNSLLTAPPQNS